MTIALALTASRAQAGLFEKFMGCMAALTEKPFLETVENPGGELPTLRSRVERQHYVTLDWAQARRGVLWHRLWFMASPMARWKRLARHGHALHRCLRREDTSCAPRRRELGPTLVLLQ